MSDEFTRVGPLLDATSYPPWAQELVAACAEQKRSVAHHELFYQMRDARIGETTTRNFLLGVWPLIEQFPQYLNLLNVLYGRVRGHDMARRHPIRNIRFEQERA